MPANIDPDWTLEDAFRVLSQLHPPGTLTSGKARNLLLQVWGELVGRTRALGEFEALIRRFGSKRKACTALRISHGALSDLEDHFEALPSERQQGRWISGSVVGEWTLLRRLGRGGSSEVWRASSPVHGTAALKIPSPGAAKRKRFALERKLLAELNGTKGVMPLLAASAHDETTGQPWLAMPEGKPIASEVARRDDARFVLRGVASLAGTLASLHARGISHRDVKPDNIYLLRGVWTLADFGIASFPGKPQLTQKGRKLGPAYFIAPEMLNAPDDSDGWPADVYSLAKTLWVLLSGQAFPPPGEQRVQVEGLRISSYIHRATG